MLVGIPSLYFSNPTILIHTFQISPTFIYLFFWRKKTFELLMPQMKIFSWMLSKRNGNEGSNKKPNPQPKSYHDNMMMHESCNQEFSDWPNGLLAIGTFGNNNNLKHSDKIGDLNEEHLLGGGGGGGLESQGSVVERGGKDIQSEKRNRGIGKTSLTFLMKKALLCGGGFAAAPSIIRDPLPDPKLDHSTMEKILRAMLHKKIYPQKPTPKKCLDMGEEQDYEKGSHESKWDKTDSEYIVLEI